VILAFYEDGTARGLFSEQIDLSTIGRLEMARASNVEWNNRWECWQVNDLDGRQLFTAHSREECLKWERSYFEAML
jgi:hypothetical protein